MTDTETTFKDLQTEANELWESLSEDMQELWSQMRDLQGYVSNRRALNEQIADREADLISEGRGKHPDIGVGRFEEYVRVNKRTDLRMKKLREGLTAGQSLVDQTESRIEFLKASIRTRTARLEQLTALLHVVAAEKTHTPKQTTPGLST